MLKAVQKWEERQSSEPETTDCNLRRLHNIQHR